MQSQSSPSPLCCHLLGPGPKPVLHSEIWPTEKEGASSSSLFNRSPQILLVLFPRCFFAQCCFPLFRAQAPPLAGTQGLPDLAHVSSTPWLLASAACCAPSEFRAWPSSLPCSLSSLTFPLGVASFTLHSASKIQPVCHLHASSQNSRVGLSSPP